MSSVRDAHSAGESPTPLRSARDRARAEITAAILDVARRQLAAEGAPSLHLRAIARELGMVSSALYRYFPSRDALLTRLIVDAYDSLGAAAEASEAELDRTDVVARFAAVCFATRTWALLHPHEYALIYGSPVPGYAAPADTIGPATRVALVLVGILGDAVAAAGTVQPGEGQPAEGQSLTPDVVNAIEPVRPFFPPEIPDRLVIKALTVWTGLFGAVSFELFGQFHNVIGDAPEQRKAVFAAFVAVWTAQLGLP